MKKRLLVLIAAMTAFTMSANAATVLSVDLSVLNQITINANTGASSVSASGSDTTGIYLESIFDGIFGTSVGSTLISGDLTSAENASDDSPSLFNSTATPGDGINIWSYTNDPASDFIAGSLAFTGTATWSISAAAYTSLLNGAAGGDVYFPADDAGDLATAMVIGQWDRVTAVPVPAAVWLFGSALFGLGALGSRKK